MGLISLFYKPSGSWVCWEINVLGDFIGVLILLNADGVEWIVKLFCNEKKGLW